MGERGSSCGFSFSSHIMHHLGSVCLSAQGPNTRLNYVQTALSLPIPAFDWHLLVVDTIKIEVLRQAQK